VADNMNNRYQELAREAGLLVHNPQNMPTKLGKFAELLVQDCIDNLYLNGYDDAMMQIKQHFGVEQ
jgi:hypothetical protein